MPPKNQQETQRGAPELKANSSYVPMEIAIARDAAAANASAVVPETLQETKAAPAAAAEYEALQPKQAGDAATANAIPEKKGYDHLRRLEGQKPYDHLTDFVPGATGQPHKYSVLILNKAQSKASQAGQSRTENDYEELGDEGLYDHANHPEYLSMEGSTEEKESPSHQYEDPDAINQHQQTLVGYTDIKTGQTNYETPSNLKKPEVTYAQPGQQGSAAVGPQPNSPKPEKKHVRSTNEGQQEQSRDQESTNERSPLLAASAPGRNTPPTQPPERSVSITIPHNQTAGNNLQTSSRLRDAASRFNMNLTHWGYMFFRYGFTVFSLGFLTFLAIEFKKLNPQEKEFIMQNPQNPLEFFILRILSVSAESWLNTRLFLFTAAYPEINGFEFAFGNPNNPYCGPAKNLGLPFSALMRAQGFESQVTFTAGGVDPCLYPQENSTFPVDLWDNLGLSVAGGRDLSYHNTAIFFWILVALSMAIAFANPANVERQTTILKGLFELIKSVAGVPFQVFAGLVKLFFTMTTLCCVSQRQRIMDWTIDKLNGVMTFLSDRIGDNATALYLGERPKNSLSVLSIPLLALPPGKIGCSQRFQTPVPYAAQLAVLQGLNVHLDNGVTLAWGERLAVEFDTLDDRINSLAQQGKLTEAIAFGDLLGFGTKECIEKHRQALITAFAQTLTPADSHNDQPALLELINAQIEKSVNQTLKEHTIEQESNNKSRIESLAQACQYLSRDVRKLFWEQRLRHLIIKHFEKLSLPTLKQDNSAQDRTALNHFKQHLITCFPGLFAILMTKGYESAMRALGIAENENHFSWFRGGAHWKVYFNLLSLIDKNAMIQPQKEVTRKAAVDLAYLYQCTEIVLAANPENAFGQSPAEQHSLETSNSRTFYQNPTYAPHAANNSLGEYELVAGAEEDSHDFSLARPKHTRSLRIRQVEEIVTESATESAEEEKQEDEESTSMIGTGVIMRDTSRQGNLPTMGDAPFGRYSQTDGYDDDPLNSSWFSLLRDDESAAEAASPANNPSRRGASDPQAETRNPLRHVSLRRQPSIAQRQVTLDELFSSEYVKNFRELMTNVESDKLFVNDLRSLQVAEAAAAYTNASFEDLHKQLLAALDPRKRETNTSRQLFVLMAALSHYCQQHPDTDDQNAKTALPAILEYHEKLSRGAAASAKSLEPHILGIYYLLLNTETSDHNRNNAIIALDKIMRSQLTKQYQRSAVPAAHARFHQPAQEATRASDSAEKKEQTSPRPHMSINQ